MELTLVLLLMFCHSFTNAIATNRTPEKTPPRSPRSGSVAKRISDWIQLSDDCLVLEPEGSNVAASNASLDARSEAHPVECGQSLLGAGGEDSKEDSKEDSSRIVGGQVVNPAHSHPWAVAFKLQGQLQYCAGSLISKQTVLTAAHCVAWGEGALNTTLHLGDHALGQTEEGEVVRRIRRIKMHRRYDARTTDFDIALVQMDREVQFTKTISPICLPDRGKRFKGASATVVGWGRTSESGPSSQKLREVSVTVLGDRECRRRYRRDLVSQRMLCAGDDSGCRDACQGDSGGPLVTKTEGGGWTQLGIVSWGRGCAQARYPGVYTRVAFFARWIKKYAA